MSSLIPDSAPFNEEQRAWLNGFFSGLMGLQDANPQTMQSAVGLMLGPTAPPLQEAEAFPWHDATLPIVDRLSLAEGKPIELKLMAAMAQLNCGSCGYLCHTYAEAIVSGDESNLTLCSPGGKETKQAIKKLLGESDHTAPSPTNSNGKAQTKGADYSRSNPYSARLLESRPLNHEGSAKDTRHVVIDLSGSGITYEVGDALGIYPSNCTDLVTTIVKQLGADQHAIVKTPLGNQKSLLAALCEDCCLKDPPDELLELLMGRIKSAERSQTLATLLNEGVPYGFDVLDVLEVAEGATVTPTEFVETLSPLNPRLYSIASSMRHVGDQVHLTVGKVVYEREGRVRKGVASTMLADRVTANETARVFVQPNHGGFTVPVDASKPIIMVGPGTGIAPFIAFIQERAATKSPGENWLFFGDQREAFDFLYEQELQEYLVAGVLTRLDTAFSRDGDKKVYVQDRMRERGAELWSWLARGAHFYVCGDASRMAADVDRALIEICAEFGSMTPDQAKRYVTQLTADRRYVRDVY